MELQVSDTVSSRGISALRALSSLQEFLFDIWRLETNLVQQIVLCFELLPHLHVVAFKATPENAMDRVLGFVKMGEALSKIRTRCTLQLRHLSVRNWHHIPQHVQLPELQVLNLTKCSYNLQIQPGRFPRLSELYWDDSSVDSLIFVFEQVGHQLQLLSFTISFSDETLEFDSLLEIFPNLSVLEINIKGSVHRVSALQPDTLSRLQTLTLNLSMHGSMQSGVLLEILRLAPKLRMIDLKSVMPSGGDLEEFAALAKDGSCMQNLEQISFRFKVQDIDLMTRNMLEEALLSCSNHCPRLTRFFISTISDDGIVNVDYEL
jgi:hypothetical protein